MTAGVVPARACRRARSGRSHAAARPLAVHPASTETRRAPLCHSLLRRHRVCCRADCRSCWRRRRRRRVQGHGRRGAVLRRHLGSCGEWSADSLPYADRAGLAPRVSRRAAWLRAVAGACCAARRRVSSCHPCVCVARRPGCPDNATQAEAASAEVPSGEPKFSENSLVRLAFGVPPRSAADLIVKDVMCVLRRSCRSRVHAPSLCVSS